MTNSINISALRLTREASGVRSKASLPSLFHLLMSLESQSNIRPAFSRDTKNTNRWTRSNQIWFAALP